MPDGTGTERASWGPPEASRFETRTRAELEHGAIARKGRSAHVEVPRPMVPARGGHVSVTARMTVTLRSILSVSLERGSGPLGTGLQSTILLNQLHHMHDLTGTGVTGSRTVAFKVQTLTAVYYPFAGRS